MALVMAFGVVGGGYQIKASPVVLEDAPVGLTTTPSALAATPAALTTTPAALAEDGEGRFAQYTEMLTTFGTRYHFTDFLYDHAHAERPDAHYIIDAADFIFTGGMDVRIYDNFEDQPGASVWTDEQGLIEWEVTVARSGLYNISLLYYSYPGRNAEIQRAVFVNGRQPFFEANPVEFRRTWVNQLDVIIQDAQGNDMRPTQVEEHTWAESVLHDAMGVYTEPLLFYLEAGRNTIGFVALREPMIIRQLDIFQVASVPTYEEFHASHAGQHRPSVSQVEPIRIEGQDAVRKSSPMLAPQSDTGGPGVLPYSPRYIRINHIGGTSWSEPGSWIEWEVEVPEAGLYHIAMNVRQNFHRGANSFRRISINGEVPFTEMESVPFGFRNGWRVDTLGGQDSPHLFWLEAGTNVIRMEAVLGEYAPYVREIQESITSLNRMYREIVMITGLSPDRWRDYNIRRRLPDLQDELIEERVRLDRIFHSLTDMAEGRSERDAVVRTMSRQLQFMHEDIERVPRRIIEMRENIGGLGTWIMMVRSQMLAVDGIYILPYDAPTPTNGSSWWRQILHEFVTLFYSFIIDFNSIATMPEGYEGEPRHIEVWLGTGRDQANIIKSMIDETFTHETNIGVTLRLVDMMTLLPSTVARQGPDVTIMVFNPQPMDFGLRGAVADISGFPGFDEVVQRFHPEAMVPYTFEGMVFGLPETMQFNMLFYRRDILHEIGLEPPDTWQDVRNSIAHLSQHYMEFGIPIVAGAADFTHLAYTMFLYQAGGALYNEDATRSGLDSDVALTAFRDFTRFYTDYRLPRDFDFINRFRFGEMPMGVADYVTHNVLQVFAPEIRGLWGMRPVPGTLQEDGSIDRATPINGTAVMMMEQAEDKYAAWEFMKWWTSAETQIQFGRHMESLMGAAARHPTANLEAFAHMPWPVREHQSLRTQMEYARGIPEVPGGYFTPRQIRNAFFTVTELETVGPRDALTDFVRLINDEIRAKRREFGFDY